MEAQREWFEKDYYSVLGVDEDASQKDITRAYRKLARENHPDSNPGDAKAEERFKDISAAYDVVGDTEKRKKYDEVRKLGPMGGGFGAGAAARSRPVVHRGRRGPGRHPRAACSTEVAAPGPRAPGLGEARTSKPSSTCPSTTRPRA